jgi:hypothetical protein
MVQLQDRKQRSEAARRRTELKARYDELSTEVSSIENSADNEAGRPLDSHHTFARLSRELNAVTLKLHQIHD